MSENQRRAVLDALPPAGSMLEWGSGGTTRWLLENLAPEKNLVTVEHDDAWADRVAGECGDRANWTLLRRPGTLQAGENASHFEECPAGLRWYIDPAPLGLRHFDLFLIDGVARGACLANVLLNARWGAKVFLHDYSSDKRADWYDWAIAAGERRILNPVVIEPEAQGYPTPMWMCELR